MQNETKAWYASKTIWGIVVAAVVAVAASFGIEPATDLPDWVTTVIQVIALAVAAFGRIVASKAIR